MTLTIYRLDGSTRTIKNVVHVLQHSHSCNNGLDVEVMTTDCDGLLYLTEDIQLTANDFYSIDTE